MQSTLSNQNMRTRELDYHEKIALLAKHCKNRRMTAFLSNKKNVPKVNYELKKRNLNFFVQVQKETSSQIQNAEQKAQQIIEDAESEADDTRNEADETAEDIINDAKETADDLIAQAQQRLNAICTGLKVSAESLPPELKNRYNQNVLLYKKNRSFHEKLKLSKDDDVQFRTPIIKSMVEADKIITENWAIIDNWDGKPIKPQLPKNIDFKMIGAARTYLSKYKHRCAPEHPQRLKYLPIIQSKVDLLIAANENFKANTKIELIEYGIHFKS